MVKVGEVYRLVEGTLVVRVENLSRTTMAASCTISQDCGGGSVDLTVASLETDFARATDKFTLSAVSLKGNGVVVARGRVNDGFHAAKDVVFEVDLNSLLTQSFGSEQRKELVRDVTDAEPQ